MGAPADHRYPDDICDGLLCARVFAWRSQRGRPVRIYPADLCGGFRLFPVQRGSRYLDHRRCRRLHRTPRLGRCGGRVAASTVAARAATKSASARASAGARGSSRTTQRARVSAACTAGARSPTATATVVVFMTSHLHPDHPTGGRGMPGSFAPAARVVVVNVDRDPRLAAARVVARGRQARGRRAA